MQGFKTVANGPAILKRYCNTVGKENIAKIISFIPRSIHNSNSKSSIWYLKHDYLITYFKTIKNLAKINVGVSEYINGTCVDVTEYIFI